MAPRGTSCDLEHIKLISENPSNKGPDPVCNTYGIFLCKIGSKSKPVWLLMDERCPRLEIRLCKNITNLYDIYNPKRGDVVRIHRLQFDTTTHEPVITNANCIVVWPSFKANSEPIYIAASPTLTPEDDQRRLELEKCYLSTLVSLGDLSDTTSALDHYDDVAGRVEAITEDQYSNKRAKISDGTGSLCLRVFKKEKPDQTDEHFLAISKFNLGDYVIATNVKLSLSGGEKKLDLSAISDCGKSLRLVEKNSLLGKQLTERLSPMTDIDVVGNITLNRDDNHIAHNHNNNIINIQDENLTSDQDATPPSPKKNAGSITALAPPSPQQPFQDAQQPQTSGPLVGLRRSVRLQSKSGQPVQDLHSSEVNLNTNRSPPSNITASSESHVNQPQAYIGSNGVLRRGQRVLDCQPYCKVGDLVIMPGYTQFKDIAGQVRGRPSESESYGNWYFQLFDGSAPKGPFYHEKHVPVREKDCSIVCVYSKQKPNDTEEHIKVVRNLKELDLVFIKNARVSRDRLEGSIKIEMNANLSHDKFIHIIDKEGPFGRQILEEFELNSVYIAEECEEDPNQSSISSQEKV